VALFIVENTCSVYNHYELKKDYPFTKKKQKTRRGFEEDSRIYDLLHGIFSIQRAILISKVALLAGKKLVQCSITSRLLVTTHLPATEESLPITRATGG